MFRYLLLICGGVFFCSKLWSANGELELAANLTIKDGLAHNGITSLLEDSKGYIWIGTYDGINRFNGYTFDTFKNSYEQDLIISNRVRSLCEDKRGNIWIGTDEGISIYEYNIEAFKNVFPDPSVIKEIQGPIIRHIYENTSGSNVICCTEGNGVLVFNDDYQCISQIVPQDQWFQYVHYYKTVELDSVNFLITSSCGLMHLNTETQRLSRIYLNEAPDNADIISIGNNSILFSLKKGIGVLKYRFVGGELFFDVTERDINSKTFTSFTIDKYNNLWAGEAFDEVYKIRNIEAFENNDSLDYDIFKGKGEPHRTSCVLSSIKSGCWVGTFNKGVFRFKLNENPFKTYVINPESKYNLRSNSMIHFCKYDCRKVLMGSQRGGLALFNTKTQTFEPLPFKNPIPDDLNLAPCFMDSKGNIWFWTSTSQMFYYLDKNSGTFKKLETTHLSDVKIQKPRTYSEDKYGNIWIGDENDLFKLTLDNEGNITGFESLNNHPDFVKNKIKRVRVVYADPQYDFIWVGTDAGGLIRIDISENISLNDCMIQQSFNSKEDKNSISSNFVSAILRLPNGQLWIGTERGGICQVINSNKIPSFQVFTEKNGLSNNVVKSIVYDNNQNIWIATNIGLSSFNVNTNKFRVFKTQEGLPFEDFWYSSVRLDNGYIMLSGVSGFCFFRPQRVSYSEQLPDVEIENLKIGNIPIIPNTSYNGRVILKERIGNVNVLNLKFDENVISLDINSLHYSTPENHLVKYKLLPINDKWIEVPSNKNTISYSGLPPGEYKLQILASNSLQEWTTPKEISLIINPPFWKSSTAIFLYVLLVLVFVLIVVSVVIKIKNLQHDFQIEALEKEREKDVHNAKLQFFTNISHEIKTPLTLINGPINSLLEKFSGLPELTQKLNLVKKQSQKITQLLEQVHDFQRSDLNYLNLNQEHFSFGEFLNDVVSDFYHLAENESKILSIEPLSENVNIYADKEKLEKVVNNLINNAFKYTNTGAEITIQYKVENKSIRIVVKDTGIGISTEDLPHVFERFYQSQRPDRKYIGGSGIGLAFTKRLVEMHKGTISVESELGVGSTFTVYLPLTSDKIDQNNSESVDILPLSPTVNIKGSAINIEIKHTKITIDESIKGSKIFIVEDNTEVRELISDALDDHFKVKTFTDGEECLIAIENEWPDVIVSDILMPNINGFELSERVKSNFKTNHIPVILLSACTSVEDQIKGAEIGVDAYLKKPFEVRHLLTTIESIIKSRRQLRDKFKLDIPLTKGNDKEEIDNSIFLQKLYALFEENLDNQNVDLDNFAKILYLNRTHFYQKVKEITNQTPFELLKLYRIKKAAELLLEQKLPVNEVYMMTGFKSRAHFTKLFKSYFNVTPGKYAEQVNESI